MPTPSFLRSARLLAVLLIPSIAPLAHAQPAAPPARPLTFEQALAYAAEHAPAIREAMARADAAGADVSLARSAYLPHLDAVWQASRATANNVFGQVLPQSIIPAMSGPVLADATTGSVWGSATGALFSWEVADFGQRRASVSAAHAAVREREAVQALTVLDIQATVASAFLDVVAAEQAEAAAQADLQRREVLARVTATLVENQLRPGVERSRADAERAAARTRVALAHQAVTLALIALGRVLGLDGDVPDVDAASLAPPPSGGTVSGPADTDHPAIQVAAAGVALAKAREDVVRHMDRPRLLFQSALFARGTGANPDGRFDATGLWLERANWASGVQFVLPNLFAASAVKARRASASALTKAEDARAQQARLAVQATRRSADALVDAARQIASNTPEQLDAARRGESQARARYDAGLTGITEVAEAQSLLAAAEYQDALARIGIWRAFLARAVATGDLSPLAARMRAAGPGGR